MTRQNNLETGLESRLLDLIRDGQSVDDKAFEELALQVFHFQYRENAFYRKYCTLSGCDSPKEWQNMPAVPAAAFKRAQIRSFAPDETHHWFCTSGTTEQETGVHYFRTLALYEAAIAPNFRRHLLPDVARMRMLALTPSPAQAPTSSLVHMMQVVMSEFGTPESAYYMTETGLAHEQLIADLAGAQRAGEPGFLLGTAFALVYLLDELSRRQIVLHLPDGSRIMETGGFKGRTREIARPDLYAMLENSLGIPAGRIVNEYGMTELSSQFYDRTMVAGKPTAVKAVPSWTRVAAVDPASGRILPHGRVGALRIWDLANLGSVSVLQTEDAGICYPEGFEVLGRISSASIRGCSLATEQLHDNK